MKDNRGTGTGEGRIEKNPSRSYENQQGKDPKDKGGKNPHDDVRRSVSDKVDRIIRK